MKLKEGDVFFQINQFGDIVEYSYLGSSYERRSEEFGNVFQTKSKAQSALKKIKKVLREVDR